MSVGWEIWDIHTFNLVADFDTVAEALDFVWDAFEAGDEALARRWMLRGDDERVKPIGGDNLVATALLAHDASQGAVAMMERLTAMEQRIQTLERLAGVTSSASA